VHRFRSFRTHARQEATPRAPLNVPAIAGVPQPAIAWASVASSLTPARAAGVIRCARMGDADAYLTLAEEIEERDLHYSSVLQTRKLAVVGQLPQITPPDDSALADEIATEFRKQVVEGEYHNPDSGEVTDFCDALFDMMDALAKGYSVLQPHWQTSESQWNYARFEWCDPRLFTFDRATLRSLRMKDPQLPDGREIPPGQFVVHFPKIKTGVRIRGGLALLATIAHVAKSFTLADWLAFCEVYGMPLRIATYNPLTMTQPEIDQLKIAIANVGHDAAALVPEGAKIEILDARRPQANGDNVFQGLADYWDGQVSKAVLGQTMTTDDGSSKAQAEVHDGVLLKYTRADARSLNASVRAQIIAPWVRFNYGDHAPVPLMSLPVDPPEDLKLFTEAVLPWVERGGMRVRVSEVREKFGLTQPDGEDDNAVLEVKLADPNAPKNGLAQPARVA
jgi:phage gp29-like protein